MPIDPAKLNSLLDEQDATAARQTTLATPVSPDDMGRALSIADRRQQPAMVVAQNLPEYDERDHLDAVQDAARQSPMLGRWLQKPEHAALAKDDLPALSGLARIAPMFQALGLPGLGLGLLRGQIERGVQQANVGHAANIGNLSAVASTAQAAGEVLDMPSQALRPMFGSQYDPLGTRSFTANAAGVSREANAELSATAIPLPSMRSPDMLSQAVAHYVQQAAQSAPSMLAAIATRNPAVGAVIMGAPAGAQTYSQLREQGVSRTDAAIAGLGTGATEVAGERLGLESLLAPWRKALLSGPLTEFGEEAVTQLAQGGLQDQATGTKTPVLTQLADAVDAGLTGFTMGGTVVLARSLGQVAKSADEAANLSEFTRTASEGKTGKRAPAAVEALVGDAGTVYVPAEAVRTLYQGSDPGAFVASLTGDAEALQTAGQHGDIAIPLAKWASVVAQQPNAEDWAKHGRTDPEGYSRADLEGIDLDAELQAQPQESQPTESINAVRDDVLAQLLASDRYRPEDAELQAALVAKTFGTLAQRSGVDPMELYQRYNLRVNGKPESLLQSLAGRAKALFQPADGGAPRGQLRIGADRSMSIDLLKGADLSTFLHETGHMTLEVFGDLARMKGADPQLKADYDTLLKWAGNTGEAITTEQHEAFAEAFETYLQEGKAPSPDLQSAFSRFRAWLLSIYRNMVSARIPLTDEVRSVMDRLIATDDEIEAAQVKQGMEPLPLTDEAKSLLSPGQWEAYVASTRDATDEAKRAVLAKLMASHKRAAEQWYKQERAKVKAEVEAETELAPAVRAWKILAGAQQVAGVEVPEPLRGLKLDPESLPAEARKAIARLGVSKKGGANAETAAAMLGFDSGDALVQALSGVRDLQARVEAETDARMGQRYPDALTDGTLPERVMEAVHGNKRVQVLEAELSLLSTLANQPRPNRRAMTAIAERAIASQRVRKLRPNDYLVAERKAAREASKAAAKGDYAEALQAKRDQAQQAALYTVSRKAQKASESRIRALKKAASDKTRKRVGKAGKSYVEALDALLDTHEVKSISGATVRRRDALRAWVARQQEIGSNTAVSEELLERVEAERVTNVADLTVSQLADLHESVANLLHLARTKNRLLTSAGEVSWKKAKALLIERLETQPGKKGGGIGPADREMLEKLRDFGGAVGNWVLQPETIVEWLDGGTAGPFHDLLWEPSEAAEHKRESLQTMVGAKLKEAFDALPKHERKALDAKFYIRSLGESVSGHSILSALLNMGNAGNRDKLLRGGRVVGDEVVPFQPEQLAEMFSHLTQAQANLAQGIWDAVNSLWPEIVEMEERLNGFAPPKIEALPVTVNTKDGPVSLRGGYFPVKYDPHGAKAGRFDADEQAKRVLSGQIPVKASTSKGHLEKRTEYVAPLLLDYHTVLTQHLDGVMGDIAYRGFLKQMYRVLSDAEIGRRIETRTGTSALKALRAGFERGAVGSFSLAGPLWGPFQGIADATMTNVSSAALGFRVPLALANIVTAPMLASARVKKRYLLAGFKGYYADMRGSAEMIHALSPMMVKRAEGRTVELQSILANLRGKEGPRKRMIEFGMMVHQWIVPLAENAIWMAAYKQAQAAGSDSTEAVRMADKAIRQTQTKHTAKDLSQAEGKPYLRWAMMFAGPMVVINNRLQESGLRGKFRGAVSNPAQALAVWVAMAAGGSIAFELMMGRGPGDEDDDGEEGTIKDWAEWCARKIALLPFAGYPVLREVADRIDRGYSRANPLVDAGNSLVQFGKTAIASADALFAGEDVDEAKLAKDATRAVGVATGIPTNQLVRTGTYLMEVGTGQHTPRNPAAEAAYLMQGPPKD